MKAKASVTTEHQSQHDYQHDYVSSRLITSLLISIMHRIRQQCSFYKVQAYSLAGGAKKAVLQSEKCNLFQLSLKKTKTKRRGDKLATNGQKPLQQRQQKARKRKICRFRIGSKKYVDLQSVFYTVNIIFKF